LVTQDAQDEQNAQNAKTIYLRREFFLKAPFPPEQIHISLSISWVKKNFFHPKIHDKIRKPSTYLAAYV